MARLKASLRRFQALRKVEAVTMQLKKLRVVGIRKCLPQVKATINPECVGTNLQQWVDIRNCLPWQAGWSEAKAMTWVVQE